MSTQRYDLQNVILREDMSLIAHKTKGGGGDSQVRKDTDVRGLLLSLDVQEAVRVPHVRVVAPNISKARGILKSVLKSGSTDVEKAHR